LSSQSSNNKLRLAEKTVVEPHPVHFDAIGLYKIRVSLLHENTTTTTIILLAVEIQKII